MLLLNTYCSKNILNLRIKGNLEEIWENKIKYAYLCNLRIFTLASYDWRGRVIEQYTTDNLETTQGCQCYNTMITSTYF